MNFNKSEMVEHPALMTIVLIISTVVVTLGTTTFATMNYVDKRYVESRSYTKEKFDTIRTDIKDIKKQIQNVNNNILRLYRGKRK